MLSWLWATRSPYWITCLVSEGGALSCLNLSSLLCSSPREACPFLNGDRGGVDGKGGIDGMLGEGTVGEGEGKLWSV